MKDELLLIGNPTTTHSRNTSPAVSYIDRKSDFPPPPPLTGALTTKIIIINVIF
jgi:hypothetical protein